MLFNSLAFAAFFPVVLVLYFGCPHRWRWALLLAASYFFYGYWKIEYLGLILLSTVVDFGCSYAMGKREEPAARRPFLYTSLVSNLGILFVFKYYNFFGSSAEAVASYWGSTWSLPVTDLLLPVGISFYTFQTMSYSIDVYYGRIKPERHFGIFALFVCFFPQLVAGPIERAGHLLPQFRRQAPFSRRRFIEGAEHIFWGFVKKVVIADRLAVFVNAIYDNPGEHGGLVLLVATVFFAFQIYCDFSGYSDIAIGTAKILGFDLMKNFDHPYLARSIPDFWRRWHISLSTWFRDYVYIPLGGNRVVKWRWYYNLFITFVVSGIWHGANWTFAVWGALHGLFIVMSNATGPLRTAFYQRVLRWPRAASVATTFALVLLTWVFFRAATVQEAWWIVTQIMTPGSYSTAALQKVVLETQGLSRFDFGLSLALVLVLYLAGLLDVRKRLERYDVDMLGVFKPVAYATGVVLFLILGVFDDGSQFIYFQF